MRRPTPEEIDNAAAFAAYQSRLADRGEAVLRRLLAAVIGILLALALVHFATPCEQAALCWAPLALTPTQALGAWWRRACRRLQIWMLRARLQQLLGTAQAMALDSRPAGGLRLGDVIVRAAAVRVRLQRLERADQVARRVRATQG